MKNTYRKTKSYLLFTSLGLLLYVGAGTPVLSYESVAEAARAENSQSGSPVSAPAQSDGATGTDSNVSGSSFSNSVAAPERKIAGDDAAKNSAGSPVLRPKSRRPLELGPNQKFSIAGFADGAAARIVPESSGGKSPAYHRVQMRLTGSMCYACLLEFQEKLKQVFGVERARVAKSEQVSIQAYSPDLSNFADAVFVYDANKLDLLDLRAYIRRSAYSPYKVVDRIIESVPPENSKKL